MVRPHYGYHVEFGDDADYVVYVAWTEHGPYEMTQWMIPGTELED